MPPLKVDGPETANTPAAKFAIKSRAHGRYVDHDYNFQVRITEGCVWSVTELGHALRTSQGTLIVVPIMQVYEPVWTDVPDVSRYRYVSREGRVSDRPPPGLRVLNDAPTWQERHGVVYL